MRVLWVVNTIFPDAAKRLGIAPPVFGGWMYGLATALAAKEDITLAVVTVYSGKRVEAFSENGINYYFIPFLNRSGAAKSNRQAWTAVSDDFQPDVVHIHGTEYEHGLGLMNTCPKLKYIVSIQGLVSVCHRYFLAGMSFSDVLLNITLRDIFRGNTLFHAKHDFYKRGLVEKSYVERAKVIIGRTDWDRAHIWSINPTAHYNFCNESLRDEFYVGDKWSIHSCRRHSIFVSQAAYPIKGLHQILRATALIKNKYPDFVLRIAGPDIVSCSSFVSRFKRSGYARFIAVLIRKLGLENHVHFLGNLNANEMKSEYLSAHVFVCPSSIENSPNSLGEAQILGVPCLASATGGIPSMVKDGVTAVLYQFDEYEMLAVAIDRLFSNVAMCNMLSENGSREGLQRHDRIRNLNNQVEIYRNVIDNTCDA